MALLTLGAGLSLTLRYVLGPLFLLLSCLAQPLYEGFAFLFIYFFNGGGCLCITTVLAVLELTFIDQTGLSDALSYTILFCCVWLPILQHSQ